MGYKFISVDNFHIYGPLLVKFGMRDRRKMLWSVCEFREKLHREGHARVDLDTVIFLVE